MAVSENSATFTAMQPPEWLENIPGDYFNKFKDEGLKEYEKSWTDIRGQGQNYVEQLYNLAPYITQGYTDASGKASSNYNEMLNRMMSGEAAIPELSADSGYMTNFTGMVPTAEDFSNYFTADQDFYSDYLNQMMGNTIELGYGDQSMSFIPGSTMEAMADIMEAMMGTQETAGQSYSYSLGKALESYPELTESMLQAREEELKNIFPGYVNEQAAYDLLPYEAWYQYSLAPYQEAYNQAQQYPEGSAWQDYMADFYNEWAPFELARFYQQPSYEVDSGESALDYIGEILGMGAGVYNAFGGSSSGSAWDSIADWFSSGSSSGDYTASTDDFVDAMSDALVQSSGGYFDSSSWWPF